MAIHIHLHKGRDAGVFSKTTPQAYGKLATSARAEKSTQNKRERGDVYQVQKRQKNGKLAPPDSLYMNLSKERAEEGKKNLERMNPGSSYEVIKT